MVGLNGGEATGVTELLVHGLVSSDLGRHEFFKYVSSRGGLGFGGNLSSFLQKGLSCWLAFDS